MRQGPDAILIDIRAFFFFLRQIKTVFMLSLNIHILRHAPKITDFKYKRTEIIDMKIKEKQMIL